MTTSGDRESVLGPSAPPEHRPPSTAQPSVLMVPYFRRNPYQIQLITALQGFGVTVTTGGERELRAVAEGASLSDVVHLHWTSEFLVAASVRATVRRAARFLLLLAKLRRRGVRLVWTVHNLQDHRRRHRRLELAATAILVRLVHRIVVHCAAAQRQAGRAYRFSARTHRKVAVIRHGHYLDWYANAVTRDEARTRLGVPADATVLLYFGRIRSYKGLSELLQVFRSNPAGDVRLVVAGRPSDDRVAAEVREAAVNDGRIVAHLDFVPDEDVQVFFNAADAVVLPYRDVLTSGTAVLAMSFGRAVLAPSLGCLPELVGTDGGILYDPDAPGGLDGAVRIATTADLASMGRRNYEVARSDDWSAVARATMETYA